LGVVKSRGGLCRPAGTRLGSTHETNAVSRAASPAPTPPREGGWQVVSLARYPPAGGLRRRVSAIRDRKIHITRCNAGGAS